MKNLITLSFLFITALLNSYAQDCEPATITNVEREGVGNRITWKMPPNGEEVTISHSGNDAHSWGVGVGPWNQIRSVGVYHRYTPEHLAAINGGELTQVIFIPFYDYIGHQQEPGHTHTIQIYKGGNWEEMGNRYPGTLIASQELNNEDLFFFQENIITLESPVTIDATKELWIGYYCTDIDTIYDEYKACAGRDSGPHKEGFGNVMIYENKWQTNYERNESEYNWVIKGIVQTIDSATVNIYFNGNELVTNFSGITYFHDNPTGEEHCYKVEVNCLEGGVSLFSDEVCIPGVGVKENGETARFMVYPNPANNELRITNYELRGGVIEIYDVYGRKQKSRRAEEQSGAKEIVIDIANLAAGVYFIRLIDEQGSAVQKFIKE